MATRRTIQLYMAIAILCAGCGTESKGKNTRASTPKTATVIRVGSTLPLSVTSTEPALAAIGGDGGINQVPTSDASSPINKESTPISLNNSGNSTAMDLISSTTPAPATVRDDANKFALDKKPLATDSVV